jgi:hypothetical protein
MTAAPTITTPAIHGQRRRCVPERGTVFMF